MPKWSDYTEKTSPESDDTFMIGDSSSNANKRLKLSSLKDWIFGRTEFTRMGSRVSASEAKITSVEGAIDELDSNKSEVHYQNFSFTGVSFSGIGTKNLKTWASVALDGVYVVGIILQSTNASGSTIVPTWDGTGIGIHYNGTGSNVTIRIRLVWYTTNGTASI